MSNWKTYKLSEILNLVGGGTPKTTVPEYWNGDIPWLSVVDFGNDIKRVYKTEKTITQKGLHGSSTKILKEGQLIISARGTVGELAVLGSDMAFNQSCYGIYANEKTENNFLYYLLKDSIGKIKKNTHGAVFDTITKQTFNNIEVTIPENIKEQTEIASILSSLDDKIELNLQMNQTLEAMAQAIFKEWFVNFNFPGFDGESVDGLPKGWKMGKLGDVCERITKGTTPTTLKKQFVEKGINFIKAEGIDDIGNFIPEKFAFIDEETNEMLKRSIIQENDIVFTIAGTLGRVAKVDKSILPANTNQAVAIIRVADNEMVNFVYHLLRSDLIKSTLLSKAVHAVQANISLGVLSAADIVIPTENIIHLFNEILNPIEEKLLSNVYETRTLTQIRDSLLPKLMTGKIEIQA